MKLDTNPRLPQNPPSGFVAALVTRLYEVLRDYARAINSNPWANEGTAAPTTGSWAQGDFVRNTAPAEAGAVGSKYCVIGWVCVAAGTPGTWLPIRTLTGN